METIVIRCSASSNVGFGHLVRCKVLANDIVSMGHRVVMVGPDVSLKNEQDAQIFYDWIPKSSWSNSTDEAKFHLKILNQYNSKYIIIDDYNSDGEHQKLLRLEGIRLVQQYDASKNQCFAANLVVNGSPHEKAEFYEGNTLYDDVSFLLGPSYSILRPIFYEKHLKEIQKERKILMTFGGGDDRGAILYILENFSETIKMNNWDLTIIVGKGNTNTEVISEWIESNDYKNIELIINPDNMAEIMSSCSFAILGGGTTISEAAYLGIPALLVPIADNQINQCVGWNDLGGMTYVSSFQNIEKEKFQSVLNAFLENVKLIIRNREKLAKIIDEHGSKRILDKLLSDE